MKKSNLFKRSCFLLSSALMVSGAFLATGCSDDDYSQSGVEFDTTKTVHTELAFAVPSTATGSTRMADTDVQEKGFLGIQKLQIVPFVTSNLTGAVVAGATYAVGTLDLTVDAATVATANKGGVKKYDVSLPTGNIAFLVYGKALTTPGHLGKLDVSGIPTSTDAGTTTQSAISAKLRNIVISPGNDLATVQSKLTNVKAAIAAAVAASGYTVNAKTLLSAIQTNFLNTRQATTASINTLFTEMYNSLTNANVTLGDGFTDGDKGQSTYTALLDEISDNNAAYHFANTFPDTNLPKGIY